MANSQTGLKARYTYATIDTAPGADGYWCAEVNPVKEKVDEIFFSRRGGGTATVTLQFKCPSDSSWTDYTTSEDLADGERHILDDHGAGVRWRAGIKEDTSADDTYTSGTITLGFDW